MATNRRRYVFYASPELEAALEDLRDATGASISSFVGQMLQEQMGILKSIAKAARMAKQKDIAALDVMNQALQEMLLKGQQMSLDMAHKAPQIRSMLTRSDDDAKE